VESGKWKVESGKKEQREKQKEKIKSKEKADDEYERADIRCQMLGKEQK